MNAKDLSILSYKELQALAVKHRVPGNIKKLLLVKILHAVKSGNSSEVTRLLTDLKKNRKKRTKRTKTMKSEEDGSLQIALHSGSPDLPAQQDHYLFPIQQQQQQQYPFQWVGAEEEVGTSKYDDVRCNLSYNDIRQFVFYTTQGVYGNCDTNNNSTLLDEIMDLRTEATVSNYRSTLDTGHINSTVQQQQILQQPVDDSASKKMSLLLKKMLQAPVGANLGEIASPVATWSMDNYRLREPSPDNSETMTAKSDINENDEIWQDSVAATPTDLPCVFDNEQNYDNSYYRRNTGTSFYRSTFGNGIEQNTMGYDQQASNQYQFNFAPQADAQENCRSWLAASNLNLPNPIEYDPTSTSRLVPTASIQYQSPDSLDLMNPTPIATSNVVQSNSQYCINSDQLYVNPAAALSLEPSDVVPDLQFDTSRYYQTPVSIGRPQESQDYYRQICDTTGFPQDLYDPPRQQAQPSEPGNSQPRFTEYTQLESSPIYHVELDSATYEPGYYQEQQQSVSTNQPVDPLQQVQNQQYESFAPAPGPSAAPSNPPPAYGTAVLDSYWPRWTNADRNAAASRMGGRSLENTLNLCTPNYVDYTKLNETCCVYSNKTPVMTLRKGLSSVPSTPETRSAAEFRQHNFASNWLLYSDADIGRTNFAQASPTYCTAERQPETII